MKTGTVKYINMIYEVYHPNGELLATTNSMAGINHCLRRYGLSGYILKP
jgi:hypothetical protein